MIMKKLLLMMVAFLATMSVSAKESGEDAMKWMKNFAPVADKANLDGLHTAVAPDGAVYASTTYDKVFEFAGKNITDPEGLLSSCIVKYDANGNEMWALPFIGKCVINAMTVDTDGILYVTGNYTDEAVSCTCTDGVTVEFAGSTEATAAFVAQISAQGVITAVRTFMPVANIPDGYENWGVEAGIFPNDIRIDAHKVLVSCMFKGDVPALEWQGSYVDAYGMAYMDNKSNGLFMLDKEGLSNPVSVATLQHTGRIIDMMMDEKQDYAEAFDFVMYDGKAYILFVGFGNLTLTTPAGSQPFSFERADDESGNKEHAFVFVDAASPTTPKIFHAAMHNESYPTYNIVGGDIVGGNCLLGGTFCGQLPLDPTKESNSKTVTDEEGTKKTWLSNAFAASITMSGASVNWANVFVDKHTETEANQATCMIATGEESHLSTKQCMFHLNTATGETKGEPEMQGFKDADSYADTYVSFLFTEGNSVWVGSPKMSPSAINEAKAGNNGAAKYYNLNGVELNAPQKGLNIVKTAEGTHTVVIK